MRPAEPTPPDEALRAVEDLVPPPRGGLFARIYAWMEAGSRRPGAIWLLSLVSCTEAFVFPLPPDIMLVPMTLARPQRWWLLAGLTTITSCLGGLIGWLIGALLIQEVLPLLQRLGQGPAYEAAQQFFAQYGFWAMIVKGLTPIPFKIFTIAAGAAHMPLLPFLGGSMIGRGMRFFLVTGVMRVAGPSVEPLLKRYIEIVGWIVIALVIVGFIWVAHSHASH